MKDNSQHTISATDGEHQLQNVSGKFGKTDSVEGGNDMIGIPINDDLETQLAKQKLITESWRELYRIKNKELIAFQKLGLCSGLEFDKLSKKEIVDNIKEILEDFKEDCIEIRLMWDDPIRREKLSHAFPDYVTK